MTMIAKKFPTAALIDGQWVTSAKTFPVTDPATGAEVAAVPNLGAEDAARAIDAAAKALPRLVRQDGERTRHHLETLVRSRHRRDRNPRPADDHRAGQAARQISRRGRLWRLLHRVVRGRRQARLRAHHPDHRRLQALPHHQAADRRRRRDRALEFPDRHDHAESGAGARRRMHHRGQARGGDSALRLGHRQARARCRRAGLACSTS